MSITIQKSSKGRPKIFDRNMFIQTALLSYWADGPKNISINELCNQTGASKPGVYREFGSDDGLKAAVLEVYANMVLLPMFDIVDAEQPFSETLNELIDFFTQDRETLGIPNGCLFVAMLIQQHDFEKLTQNKIDQLHEDIIRHYSDLINRAKDNGEFLSTMKTDVAALYFDAQNISAMTLQKQEVPNNRIAELLRTAFSVFQ